MSLRSRVLWGFLAITVLLVATDIVIAVTVHRSLIDQVDRRIEPVLTAVSTSHGFRGRAFFNGPTGSGALGNGTSGSNGSGFNPATTQGGSRPSTTFPDANPGGRGAPPADQSSDLTEFWIARMSTDGSLLRNTPVFRNDKAPPHLDVKVISKEATAPTAPLRYFTVGADGNSGLSYRVAATRVSTGYYVVGVSLSETDATFSRLVAVAVGSTLAVLVALALIAFWVIRLGVRPVDEMAATANAIAEGDLSRRVEVGPDNTEVGRLGVALNGMMHQIESAFGERQASEVRLRQFIADASHELRTPLTSIQGYTELYRTGIITEGPELDDAMRRIEGESSRMGELVEDLLLLARLDQGRPLESRPVDLAALARDAVADARAVEPDRPIELEVPPAPVTVVGDERRLRQVVGNLLANARTHTPAGTAVAVRVRSSAGRALIEVADHGPGIPPDVGNRVFERFYRGDPARVRDGHGAGLGLSIVAAVAASHHGRAWVESDYGRGATFHVELPLADLRPPDASTRVTRPDVAPPGQASSDAVSPGAFSASRSSSDASSSNGFPPRVAPPAAAPADPTVPGAAPPGGVPPGDAPADPTPHESPYLPN
jgi:two-component system, OmpR family, sensor kinase